jgi:hypothetical protein
VSGTGEWGQPTEEELVAIMAAVELVWPRPAASAPAPDPVPLGWRFSGRWWSRPTISRSDRPWIAPTR